MKTKAIHLSLALLTITGATAQPGGEQEGHRPPPVPPLFALFDADHDGSISAPELENASAALATLDEDNDGEIILEELRPPAPEGGMPQGPPPGERPAPPVIAALDTDRDGIISAAEIEAAPESLVTLDKNEDGFLTPQELQPRRPRPPHGEGAPNGRRPSGPLPEDEPSFGEE